MLNLKLISLCLRKLYKWGINFENMTQPISWHNVTIRAVFVCSLQQKYYNKLFNGSNDDMK